MITRTIDPHQYVKRARQIQARMPILLSRWGLLPRFKRWRLAQDPDTGMVVLFGVLNNKYIVTHTTTSLTNYFDPGLLSDLETELNVKIISSTNDGLRYAFILERGRIDMLPAHLDPVPDRERLVVRVVYNEEIVAGVAGPQITPEPQSASYTVEDQALVDQGVGAFLKVFQDIKLKNAAAQPPPLQDPPADFSVEDEKLYNAE